MHITPKENMNGHVLTIRMQAEYLLWIKLLNLII